MVVSVHKEVVRCTLVGDGMVGKTCLAKAFTDQGMPEEYVSTVHESYSSKIFVDGAKYHLKLNDLAGEHEVDCSTCKDYKETDVFIVCYSVVDRESFESVRDFWTTELHAKAKKRPLILVATQTDLRRQGMFDHVTKMEGDILARNIGADAFVETSAFNKDAVSYVFKSAVATALRHQKTKSLIRKVFAR